MATPLKMSTQTNHSLDVVVLLSAPLVHAPSVIRWAIHNYNFGKNKKKQMIEVVMCWGNEMMTKKLAKQILNQDIELEFDDLNGKVRCYINRVINPKAK